MFSFVAALYLLETKQVGKEQSELNDLMLGVLCEGSRHNSSLLLLHFSSNSVLIMVNRKATSLFTFVLYPSPLGLHYGIFGQKRGYLKSCLRVQAICNKNIRI